MNQAVGIVGYGVVGKALSVALTRAGFMVLHFDTDVKLAEHLLEDVVRLSKVIFICVPTPKNISGSQYPGYVFEALQSIDNIVKENPAYRPVVLIKSTILPGVTKMLQAAFPRLRLGCNPEFLRQLHAKQDACYPSRIVIGLCNPKDRDDVQPITEAMEAKYVIYTTPNTAELIKYMSNAFLLTKVAFANLTALLCKLYNADAATVHQGLTLDPRIASSHLDPALGKMPENGPCLPKDLLALKVDLDDTKEAAEAVALLELLYDFAVE